MNTYIYSVVIDPKNIQPSDDVNGISILNIDNFKELIARMFQLSGRYQTEKFSFNWEDWGKIYGYIHEKALECAREIMT
jgi:hypothetical protein